MKTALDHVLRHNTWANGTLLEFCRGLDPARFDDKAPGTYGSLYRTLQHLIGAEQSYVQLLTGEIVGARIRRAQRHTLDELASIAAVILAQLVHHGNEHRTQVTTILGSNGIEPPPVSAWGYGRAAGISETGE